MPRYRGRVFGLLRGRIEPPQADAPLRFAVGISLPLQPRSETWVRRGTLGPDGPVDEGWSPGAPSGFHSGEDVMFGDRELLEVPGPEGYPQAIVAQARDGSFEVLLSEAGFDTHRIDAAALSARSRREHVDRTRTFRETRERLEAEYRAEGMNAGAARFEAYERMKEMGLLRRDPVVTAVRLTDAVPEDQVFVIRPILFEVGLMKDVAAAIAEPGTPVPISGTDHLQYGDDDTGPRLRRYRHAHDRFVVEVDGERWVLEETQP